jgi:hypothetical protein
MALQKLPFDPGHPQLHASYARGQCLDWARAVEASPEHGEQPALLIRLGAAAMTISWLPSKRGAV